VVTEKMRKKAESLGVTGQLEFRGWLSGHAYEKALGDSTLVIVPSICFDSFPTMILDAMKLAKPVVATNLGGAKEMVNEGVSGYIADPMDIESFSQRIADILTDPNKARELGIAGRKRLETRFTQFDVRRKNRDVVESEY